MIQVTPENVFDTILDGVVARPGMYAHSLDAAEAVVWTTLTIWAVQAGRPGLVHESYFALKSQDQGAFAHCAWAVHRGLTLERFASEVLAPIISYFRARIASTPC